MIRKISLTAISFMMLFSSCNDTGEKIYYAKDFGIYPDSTTLNASPLMAKALQQIKAESGSRNIRFVFEKGTYDFYPEASSSRTYYISNHDQDNPKHVAIALEGFKNFTLDGAGASFYTHGRMLPLSLVSCENCTIEHLSIDSRNPQISQAVILENDTRKGEITYRLADDVNYRIENGNLITYGLGWEITPCAGIAFENKTRHLVYNTSDFSVGTSQVSEIEPHVLKAPWKNDRLIPSTVVALRNYARPTPGIFINDCKNTNLEDVTVHYAEGMGLLAQMSEDITLNRFQVSLREGSDRYFTTQADATHFSACKGKISSTNGLYEGMMDDAINVHGTYLRVVKRLDEKTVVGRYMHGQAYGFNWGNSGDSVQFVKSNTMEITGHNVIEAIAPYDQATTDGCKEFKISFEQTVAEDIDNGNYGIENLEWTPEVYFADNVIRNNRARGSLFSTPKRTVVENNVFDHTSGTAILLCGDCNGWFETGACREVIIRNNHFINALTNMFQFTNGIISIYPEIPNLKDQKTYFHGGTNGGVFIENNTFETFDMPLVYAKSLDGLTFSNNRILQNNDYAPFHWNKHRLLLEHVTNVKIEGNQFENTTFDPELDVKYTHE